MNIRAEFIVGKQSSKEWSGIYGFRPEEVINPVELFVVMRISTSSDNSGLERIAKMLLDELQQSFYDQDKSNEDSVDKLENSVWKLKSRMELILSREEDIMEDGIDIELAEVILDNQYLYAAIIGESKIYIKRGENFVDISKGLIDRNMMGFVKAGSLKLIENDVIVLATSKAVDLGKEFIDNAATDLDINYLKNFKEQLGAVVIIVGDESMKWIDAEAEQIVLQTKMEENIKSDDNLIHEDLQTKITTEIDLNKLIESKEKDIDLNPSNNIDEDLSKNIDVEAALPGSHKRIFEDKEYEVIDDQEVFLEEVEDKPLEKTPFNLALEKGNKLRVDFFIKIGENLNLIKNKIDNRNKLESNKEDYLENNSNQEDRDQFNKEDVSGEEVNKESFQANLINKSKNLWNNKISKTFKNNKTYSKFFQDVLLKFKELGVKGIEFFKTEIIGTGDRRSLYLKANRRKRNRWILIGVLIILLIIIYSGIRSRQAVLKEQARIDNINTQISSIQSQLDKITPQVTDAKTGDQTKKDSLITQLAQLNSNAESLKNNGLSLDKINNIETNIQSTKDDILSINGFINPQLIADTAKTYSDSTVSDLVLTQGNLYALDSTRGVMYKFGTTINSQVTQFATGLTKPYILIKNKEGDLVFYDNDLTSGLGKVNLSDGKVSRFPGLAPGIIGKVDAADIFNSSNGNDAIYELHDNNKQIFKRKKIGANYDTGGANYETNNLRDWKSDDGDLVGGVSISVPYEAYVLIKDKGLKRYLSGADNTLTFQAFTGISQQDFDSLNKATCVTATSNFVVVGDPVDSRILIFSITNNDQKNLNLIDQYAYRGNDKLMFQNITKIAIDESTKSIFVLDGTKVLRFDLK